MAEMRFAVTHLQYAGMIGEGEIWSRKDFVQRTGKSYTTCVYHLKNACEAGLLNCQIGHVSDGKVGWLYALPTTMPRLPGV